MLAASRTFFSALISRTLAAGGTKRVFVASHQRGVGTRGRGLPNTQPVPRITVCLKGRARYEFTSHGTTKIWELEPGDSIFVPPDCPLRVCADSDYDSLGAVFFHDLTRLIEVHSSSKVRNSARYPFNLNRRVVIWPRPLPETGQSYVRELTGHGGPNPELKRQASMNLLFFSLLDLLAEEELDLGSGKSRLVWQAACSFIDDHLHLPLGRDEVARHLKIHPNHVSRLFAQFGKSTFVEYITKKRMTRARAMLADPRWNVTDVALQCGFTSLSYFARVCHVELGLAPSQFRHAAVLSAARDAELGSGEPKPS